MAEEDNAALSENLVQYAERSARAEARVSDIEAQLETLTMNAQPLGLGLPGQAYGMNYAHNAMQAPQGLYGHHGNAYYAPQQDPGRHMYRHPGPFGTPGQWTQYAQASGQPSSKSTKRRKIGNHGREQWNDNSANQFQTSGQGSNGFGRGGGGRGMGSNGGRVNLDPLFNGNSGRGAYTNTLKTFDNLKYCPNKGCGYDVDHMGYECPYYAPWNVERDHGHLVPGASTKGQHKTLADGTGAGLGWLMAQSITSAQWVMEQRREYGRNQQGRGGGRGGGRGAGRGNGRGEGRGNNGRGRGNGYARGGCGGGRY